MSKIKTEMIITSEQILTEAYVNGIVDNIDFPESKLNNLCKGGYLQFLDNPKGDIKVYKITSAAIECLELRELTR